MNKIIFYFFCFSLIVPSGQVFGQPVAKGVVYNDANFNNKKDKGEQGIGNVGVSNGVDVVLTDAQGAYELPIQDQNIIFVIKPANYTFTVDTNNLPQFYYIHKPKGSPSLKFAGSKPTGDMPKSVDFALKAIDAKEDFRMLVFGDPQTKNIEEVDFFYKGIIREIENVKDVDLGITLGDLVHDNLDLFVPYKEAIRKVGVPWFNVLGNHDMNLDAEIDQLSDETFEAHFGPATYAFNHGKVHFIVMDNVLYPDPRKKWRYWGGLRPDQLQFIENDLKHVSTDKLIVLAMHIPLSERLHGDTFSDDDANRLYEMLQYFPHTLSLSAHSHLQSQDFILPKNGWKQDAKHHHFNVGTTCGDWYSGQLNSDGVPVATMRDGTRKGYAYINFNKNSYTIDYKVAGFDANYKMEIYAPKVVVQNKRTTAGIAVNFFIGSEYDTLYCRIDTGKWQQMQYKQTVDPSYLSIVKEWDETDDLIEGKRPSNPVNSTHLWVGDISPNLELGTHIIEIKAIDMFGRLHMQTKEYQVIAGD